MSANEPKMKKHIKYTDTEVYSTERKNKIIQATLNNDLLSEKFIACRNILRDTPQNEWSTIMDSITK